MHCFVVNMAKVEGHAGSVGGAYVIVGVILIGISSLILALPPLPNGKESIINHLPPRNIQDVITLREILLMYGKQNPQSVAALWSALYLAMQTFAIPGTICLSVIAGSLWGVQKGLTIVSIISTIGSCSAFNLSRHLGTRLAHRFWPDKVDNFAAKVAKRRGEMFNYILFLRLTPLLPNTFINVVSPVVGVPLRPFVLG